MSYEVDRYPNGEVAFHISEDESETETGTPTRNVIHVHPWERRFSDGTEDRSVYVSVGWEEFNPEYGWVEAEPTDDIPVFEWNIIVDREDFVDALVATFPELKRA